MVIVKLKRFIGRLDGRFEGFLGVTGRYGGIARISVVLCKHRETIEVQDVGYVKSTICGAGPGVRESGSRTAVRQSGDEHGSVIPI